MTDRAKQVQALQLLFLLIPDSHYQLLKDTLLLLHATVQEVNRLCGAVVDGSNRAVKVLLALPKGSK